MKLKAPFSFLPLSVLQFKPSVNRHDVEFMIGVVWGKADSITREPMGHGGSRMLLRWDMGRPAARDNLVLVTKAMAHKLQDAFGERKAVDRDAVIQNSMRPHANHPDLPELTPERVQFIEQRLALTRMWAYQM